MLIDNETLKINCKQKLILLRPNASNGLWLSTLIPSAYMVNLWNRNQSLELPFKITIILAFGLFLQTWEIFYKLSRPSSGGFIKNAFLKLIPGAFTSFLLWICLEQEIPFCCLTSFTVLLIYNVSYILLLKKLKFSFTLGEGAIVTQAFVLLMYNIFLKLLNYSEHIPVSDFQKITVLLEIVFLGVTFIVLLTYICVPLQGLLFYPFSMLVIGLCAAFPITHDCVAVLVLMKYIFHNLERIFIVCIALGLLGVTGSGVAWYISRQNSATTRTRKVFHLLVVLVFVPGLLFQCTMLYMASGVLLAAFILLELIRINNLWPFHEILQQTVSVFVDEKDAGVVSLTPMYLLAGCALPMWLHPCPCDVTDSAGRDLLPLMAGVLSVGVGDTVASFVGSKFGKHKWEKDGSKSIEGTVFSIIAQSMVPSILSYFGYVQLGPTQHVIVEVAIILNGIVEAYTDQIDNLVLPLITYVVVSLGDNK